MTASTGTYLAPRPRPDRPKVDIVVPCFNEADALDFFVGRIREVLHGCNFDYEMLFVDDGSTDATRRKLTELANAFGDIRLLTFSRNFGKEAALTAGLDHAQGDAVIVIDVDLQDPPELILRFVEKWREGYDIVYGTRDDRQLDSHAKRVTAEGFYRLFNRISGVKIPVNTGDFRLMDRRVVDAIRALPERSRFMKGLFAWVGFNAVGVKYARPERAAGESKFNFWKLWNFALDGIVGFSTVPLRVWSYAGSAIAMLSFIYASIIIFQVVIFGRDVPGYASLLVLVLFFGGVQLVSIGVLGEYIARLFTEVKRRPVYIVDEIVGGDQSAALSNKGA